MSDWKAPSEEEKAKFVEEFEEICKKNKNLTMESQVQKWKDHRFRQMTIREKIQFLDTFSEEQKSKLSELWPVFRKLIDSRSIVTFVRISSKWAKPVEHPFEGAEKPTTPAVTRSRKGKAQESTEPALDEHKFLKVEAQIGRFRAMEKMDGGVEKVYEKWNFEFDMRQQDGALFSKCWVEGSDEAPIIEMHLEEKYLSVSAGMIEGFIARHEQNFVEDLLIDVKQWPRTRFRLKFEHVQKLRITHNGPISTHIWMSRVDTNGTIPEVIMNRNYDGKEDAEQDFRRNFPFLTSEAMPYIIPFEDNLMPVWATSAKNPMLRAEKLTFTNTIENSLCDLSRMSSLREIDMNRMEIQPDELNEFLGLWSNGQMGHRLTRVNVRVDYPMDFLRKGEDKNEFWKTFEQNFGARKKIFDGGIAHLEISDFDGMSPELKETLDARASRTFVIYRQWNQAQTLVNYSRTLSESSGYNSSSPPLLPTVAEGQEAPTAEAVSEAIAQKPLKMIQRKPSNVSCSSDSTASSDAPSSWVGGSCAVLQIDSNRIQFTAVRNEKIASELIALRQVAPQL